MNERAFIDWDNATEKEVCNFSAKKIMGFKESNFGSCTVNPKWAPVIKKGEYPCWSDGLCSPIIKLYWQPNIDLDQAKEVYLAAFPDDDKKRYSFKTLVADFVYYGNKTGHVDYVLDADRLTRACCQSYQEIERYEDD